MDIATYLYLSASFGAAAGFFGLLRDFRRGLSLRAILAVIGNSALTACAATCAMAEMKKDPSVAAVVMTSIVVGGGGAPLQVKVLEWLQRVQLKVVDKDPKS